MKSHAALLLSAFILFLAAGLVTAYISFQSTSPEDIVSNISTRLVKEMDHIDQEAKISLQALQQNKSIDIHSSSEHIFLLYNRNELVYWSDNSFIPAIQTVSDTFSIKLLKASNGNYLAKKWKVDANRFLVVILLLHKDFKIRNDYLNPQWNKKIFPEANVSILDSGSGRGLPVCIQNDCVFNITFLDDHLPFHEAARWVALGLLSISIFLFVLLLYAVLPTVKKYSLSGGFVFLGLSLLIVRVLMVVIDFPNNLVHTDLFNPENFASSVYNSSLGDMVCNEILVLAICYYMFKNYARFEIFKFVYRSQFVKTPVFVLYTLCVLFASLYPFVVIQTLFNNSSIALDISQSLRFDVLRIGAYLSVLLAWGCSFLFSHVFIRLLIANGSRVQTIISFGIGVLFFILINRNSGQSYQSSLLVGCFYFAIVYFLRLYGSLQKLSYTTFVYLFVTVFCFSANGAYAINHFNNQEKIENQFRFASNFLIDRDYFGEYLLHEASVKIAKDAFIRIRMGSPFVSKDVVRQKVRQVFLPTYFNKYDVNIFLFNPVGSPFDNRENSTFSEVIALYDKEAFRTEYKEVHFINSPSVDVTQKYLVIIPIQKLHATAGYVVIELSLKKIIPESVYPELLVDNRSQQFYKTQDLSYAVFSDKDIVFSSGVFNYEGLFSHEWLGQVDLYKTGLEESGYLHVAQEDELGRAAVVSSKITPPFYVLANFSFFLVLGLFVILLLILIEGFLSYLKGNKLFFSTRIQLFLNLAFFLPLIVVSITTLGLTSRSSKEQLDSEYLSKSKTVGGQIASYLNDYLSFTNENQIDFENQLTDLAKLTNLDANVYNTKGVLMATSQPLIFENNLISLYSNPSVLRKISQGENLFIETEHVGRLEYFVAYAALKSPQSGKLIGILGIPFFQSVYSLEKIQTIIFTNIVNIFAGIFIVLLLLSYFVSEWLTFPLRFITQTLKRTSLIKTNQPLTWRADDEIGLMVKEYNQMLYKLSENKAELEQTQREMAWREIAQQVAHEIKNPLTPMKLTLQQMERSIQSGTNSKEKTEKSISSLLIQVDTLSDIASSFSSFAKMPEPVIQELELISLLRRIVNLHNQSGEVIFKTTLKELVVKGDEQLLGRTFSNIILNGLQAAKPGRPVTVDISIERSNGQGRIIFKDNGNGIPDEIADQVFVPHFSTKKSGSGLGLAIAKQGIHHMGGRIWFDTQIDKGTSFFIELPEV